MNQPLSTTALVNRLQDNDQDYEWYPTTPAMLAAIRTHIISQYPKPDQDRETSVSVLDCGAGDGRSLMALAGPYGDKYAIEISPILRGQQDRSIIPVGCDFRQSTLIDKQTDVIFSNPPYSEFQEWAVKIIREANAKDIYLILPQRWEQSRAIQAALEARKAEARLIDQADFQQADRPARARVHILHISLIRKRWHGGHHYSYETNVDPFELWFDATFDKEIPERGHAGDHEELKARCQKALLAGRNLIDVLVTLYQHDMARLQQNYTAAVSLDPELLMELDISYNHLKTAIRQRIQGLKHRYWQELFNHYAMITHRLTTDIRQRLLNQLHNNMTVDFTVENAYAITHWVIRNANHYHDAQLVAVAERMVRQANIQLYKSNQRVIRDEEWRHNRSRTRKMPSGLERYRLEYRIVLENMGGINTSRWDDRHAGLEKYAADFINDLLAIARTLGWSTPDTATHRDQLPRQWESNQLEKFVCANGETLMDVRAFKKGTLHIRFHQKFIKQLNIALGRLKGWLRDKSQVTTEMPDITPMEAERFFNQSLQLGADVAVLLLTRTEC